MKKYWVGGSAEIMKDSFSLSVTPSLAARSAFFYLQTAGHFHCGRNYCTRREGYKNFLLIYTVSGKGYAKYRERNYELRKGQILIMDCYDFQEYWSDREDLWEIKWIHFNGSTSCEYYNTIYDKYGPVLDLSGNDNVSNDMDEIIRLARGRGDIQTEIRISRLIVGILTEILLAAPQKSVGRGLRITDEHIQKVLSFIESKYKDDIALRDMAAVACSSEYHFSRTFKKAVGYSPYEYLLKHRLNAAKNLLKNTNDTVDEIAGSVGFGSTSNFIRTFREIEGLTPLKYRRYFAADSSENFYKISE